MWRTLFNGHIIDKSNKKDKFHVDGIRKLDSIEDKDPKGEKSNQFFYLKISDLFYESMYDISCMIKYRVIVTNKTN